MQPYRTARIVLIHVVAFSTYVCVECQHPAEGYEEHATSPNDAICGPRAVQMILSQFGKEERIHRLVEEIQPSAAYGSSMATLDDALRKRGIFTVALHVGPSVRINWEFPVLIHLKGNGRNRGHFAVQLPSKDQYAVEVWFGPGDYQKVPWQAAATRRSGAVLLTSSVPINDPRSALCVDYSPWWQFAVFIGCLGLVGLGVFILCPKLRKERTCET